MGRSGELHAPLDLLFRGNIVCDGKIDNGGIVRVIC